MDPRRPESLASQPKKPKKNPLDCGARELSLVDQNDYPAMVAFSPSIKTTLPLNYPSTTVRAGDLLEPVLIFSDKELMEYCLPFVVPPKEEEFLALKEGLLPADPQHSPTSKYICHIPQTFKLQAFQHVTLQRTVVSIRRINSTQLFSKQWRPKTQKSRSQYMLNEKKVTLSHIPVLITQNYDGNSVIRALRWIVDTIIWPSEMGDRLETCKAHYGSIPTLTHKNVTSTGYPPIHGQDPPLTPEQDATNRQLPRRRSRSMVSYRVPFKLVAGDDRAATTQGFKTFARNLHFDKNFGRKFKYNGRLTSVSDETILREWYKQLFTNRAVTGLNLKSFTHFRDICRISRHWDVNLARVKALLFSKIQQVSFGSIPANVAEKDVENAIQLRWKEAITPVVAKDKKEDEKDKKARIKQEIERAKQISKRKYAPQTTDQAAAGPDKQNTDIIVRFGYCKDPNLESFLFIKTKFNYIDSGLERQPTHRTEIHLTWKNCRLDDSATIRGDSRINNPYEPTHRFIDVTHPIFLPFLRKIFPHPAQLAPKDEKNDKKPDYFEKLLASNYSDARHYLVIINHNNEPDTMNLFGLQKSMPAGHATLSQIMRSPQTIYVLVRSVAVPSIVDSVIRHYPSLAAYDPSTAFFKNSKQLVLSLSNLRDYRDMPNFTVPMKASFADWIDYSRRVLIGEYIEHSWKNDVTRPLLAKARYIPIPGTWNATLKRWGAYFIICEIEYEKDRPLLTEGDQVSISFNTARTILPATPWKATVTEASVVSSTSTITLLTLRPFKKGLCQDDRELASVSAQEVIAGSIEAMQQRGRTIEGQDIALVLTPQYDEIKRHFNGFQNFHVSQKEQVKYIEKVEILEGRKQLLMCCDHERLPSSGLWDQLEDSTFNDAINTIRPQLRDYQQSPFNEITAKGCFAGVCAITGSSGSGKSHLARLLTSPFTYKVCVPIRIWKQLSAQYGRYIRLEVNDEDEGFKIHFRVQPVTKDDGEYVEEHGRILQIAQKNSTVDEMHRKMKEMLNKSRSAKGQPPALCIRCYTKTTERATQLAHVDPLADTGPTPHPFLTTTERVFSDLGNDLMEHFIRDTQGNVRHVRDNRVQVEEFHNTNAEYAYQLAGLADMSPELKYAVGNPKVLEYIRQQLAPLKEAREAFMDAQLQFNADIRKNIAKAAKIAEQWLAELAHVTTTTVSIAHEASTFILRRPHVVILEEASKEFEAATIGIMSMYWQAKIVLVGDTAQPGPKVFCPPHINNFGAQRKVSLLVRLKETGFPMNELNWSSRFGNEEMLQICRIANTNPRIQMAIGAERLSQYKHAVEINSRHYSISHGTVFIDVEATPQQDALKSTYNVDTARIVFNDILLRLREMPGSSIAALTYWRAQLTLLARFRRYAIGVAKSRNDKRMAEQLENVVFETVDTFQGHERSHIILDLCCQMNGFVYNRSRNIVALTRMRDSITIVGNARETCKDTHFVSDFPLKVLVRALDDTNPHARRIYSMTPERLQKLYSFQKVLD